MKTLIFKKLFLGGLCIVLSANACSKDNDIGKDEILGWIDAIVIDTGSPAFDGCGILIQIDDTLYSPVSIKESYEKDRQELKIKYKLLDEYYGCGFGLINKYKKIEITEVKKR